MEDEGHETYQSEKINGIGLNVGRFNDEPNEFMREGIVAGMDVGSLRRSKSANKSRYRIVEDGIEFHRRTRLTMA